MTTTAPRLAESQQDAEKRQALAALLLLTLEPSDRALAGWCPGGSAFRRNVKYRAKRGILLGDRANSSP